MECIRHALLVGFLGQRIVDKVEISLLIDDGLEKGEVLLQGAVGNSLVEVFDHVIQFLIYLTYVHVHLVHVALGLEDSCQLLD